MRRGRRQHDLTILADGTVLASGGNGSGARFVDLDAGVRTAEVWDPATGRWSDAATSPSERQYHSIALLLPDGRVLSAGGGYCAECGTVGYHAQSAEIWTPPYLYARPGRATGDGADGGPDVGTGAGADPDAPAPLAARPSVETVPERIDWGTAFEVLTPDASRIRRVHLIKLGSVTHSQNQDQRLVPLAFRTTDGALVVDGPVDRREAPPGHYLLFLVDEDGVPSFAPIVQVGQPLLRSGDVVVDAVRAGVPELHEVLGRGEHALEVRLQGNLAELILGATARGPDGAVREAALSCAASEGPAGGRACTAVADADTRWLIRVEAAVDADYALLARTAAVTGADAAPASTPAFGHDPAAPPAPVPRLTDLAVDAVELAWDAPFGDAPFGDASIVGHEIHRDGRLRGFRTGTGLREGSLRPDTTYAYRVVAVDAAGRRSRPSAPVLATTPPYEGPDPDERYHPEIPSAPSGVRAFRYSNTAAELFWEPSWDDGRVVGYEVYRDGRLVATLDATSWLDGAVEPGARHEYAVLAIDDDGRRSIASSAVLAPPARERVAVAAGSGNGGGSEGGGGGLAPWALLALAGSTLRGRRERSGRAL